MTDVVSFQEKIQQEEVRFKSSISEATAGKIGGNINAIIDGNGEPVGTVVTSILTVSQFTTIRPASKWVRMEGQSIVGSDLESLTGITTLPDTVTTGRFPRQTDDDANIGDVQSNQNKSHKHDFYTGIGAVGGDPNGDRLQYDNTGDDRNLNSVLSPTDIFQTSGGSETRPEAFKVNLFIKINN